MGGKPLSAGRNGSGKLARQRLRGRRIFRLGRRGGTGPAGNLSSGSEARTGRRRIGFGEGRRGEEGAFRRKEGLGTRGRADPSFKAKASFRGGNRTGVESGDHFSHEDSSGNGGAPKGPGFGAETAVIGLVRNGVGRPMVRAARLAYPDTPISRLPDEDLFPSPDQGAAAPLLSSLGRGVGRGGGKVKNGQSQRAGVSGRNGGYGLGTKPGGRPMMGAGGSLIRTPQPPPFRQKTTCAYLAR